MINLLGLDSSELKEVARACGQPAYRGDQLARWLFGRFELALDKMTDLPRAFREQIEAAGYVPGELAFVADRQTPDGTRKVLFASPRRGTLEVVLMPHWPDPEAARSDPQGIRPERVTTCISTQIGCAVGCAFCATGFSGFQRNVAAGEMVEQVVRMQREAGHRISNVVFMGMGEPLLNYNDTLKAVRILNEEVGIGMRHLTISTAGIIPGIDRLAAERLQLTLAVSLHAPDDILRDALVPINRRYPLADLKAAMKRYVTRTSRRITIEYVLLAGVNDSTAQARDLVRYLEGLNAHVNLIPYNATDAQFEPSRPEAVEAFREVIERSGRAVSVRVERGRQIDAACGQLRRRLAEGGEAILEKDPARAREAVVAARQARSAEQGKALTGAKEHDGAGS